MDRPVGVIGAEEQEVELLVRDLSDKEKTVQGRYTFISGNLSGVPTVIVRCGIGKVNAACCAQMMIDLFNVRALINTGAAGSLDARINIGDIVLCTEAIQHDMDVAGLGYEPGMIPDTGKTFKADEKLRSLARECCREVNPDLNVFEGRILTGDQFISGSEAKDHLVKTFGGMCAEMEGGAIAQAAYCSNVPFLVIRAISDKADGSAEMDYPTFSAMASAHSAKLVEAMIGKMKND
ncbi:MAG: 5'-methylthioadenosine/adenosylhomocysteine nucleosidase [Lachnospiraceae bacterium]|jgi:adenosylhomocysteine nucleosidase